MEEQQIATKALEKNIQTCLCLKTHRNRLAKRRRKISDTAKIKTVSTKQHK